MWHLLYLTFKIDQGYKLQKILNEVDRKVPPLCSIIKYPFSSRGKKKKKNEKNEISEIPLVLIIFWIRYDLYHMAQPSIMKKTEPNRIGMKLSLKYYDQYHSIYIIFLFSEHHVDLGHHAMKIKLTSYLIFFFFLLFSIKIFIILISHFLL